MQMNARGPRPTVLTHCYHWICITPYGMCTPLDPQLFGAPRLQRKVDSDEGRRIMGTWHSVYSDAFNGAFPRWQERLSLVNCP